MTPRDALRTIWDAALAAGDVAPLIRSHLHLDHRHTRIFLLGAGKAIIDKGFKFAGEHGFGNGQAPQPMTNAGQLISALSAAGAACWIGPGVSSRSARVLATG